MILDSHKYLFLEKEPNFTLQSTENSSYQDVSPMDCELISEMEFSGAELSNKELLL